MTNQTKGILLIFSTAVISGFSVFLNKFGVAINNPDIFTFAKNTIVAILLTMVLLAFRQWRALLNLNKNQWLQLFLLSLVGGSIPFLLFFKGLALTSAVQGAFIHKTLFLFVAVLAVIFLKEKLNKNFLIGGLLLLTGISLTLKSLDLSFALGDGLILLAVIFWSVENVLAKYLLRETPGNLVAWGRMFFGSALILIYLMITNQAPQITSLSVSQLGWIALTSLLLFAYVVTWYNGLKFMPVSFATTILLLGLPITTLLSAVYTGKIIPQDIISGSLILAGLIIALGIIKTSKTKAIITQPLNH